ncbi:hypothetical protein MP228_005392 [Amoeboaphelidium protococcarum]|nr:hypothetical protein MP228_006000 [Amoeboaphelidium protococcarum]KAI3649760.1 hypothetical protein MP228_005392 [Amoeboaphelidium protococcarum]
MVNNLEAFVTLVTTEDYVIGALVLAQSLRAVGTTRQLVAMITGNISAGSQEELKAVFNQVITVDSLKSSSLDNLKVLGRPELAYTYTKLHIWNLVNFDKVVFMDADTLVLKNIDNLFTDYQLSGNGSGVAAAPDMGWPDCFNSGVFVAKPSKETFENLIKFAESQGSFDGGDQGLLNDYFKDWARIPFLFNVGFCALYSYVPAFHRFRSDVKVVHFLGDSKPWNFDRNPDGTPVVHGNIQTSEEFLKLWWQIHDRFYKKERSTGDGSSVPVGYKYNPTQFQRNQGGSYTSDDFSRGYSQSQTVENTNPFFKSRYDWNEQELGMNLKSSGSGTPGSSSLNQSHLSPVGASGKEAHTRKSNPHLSGDEDEKGGRKLPLKKQAPAYVNPPKK